VSVPAAGWQRGMEPCRGHLEWIARNRQWREAAVPVGECLSYRGELAGERAAIRRAIASFVDEEFRAHCTLGDVDRARVVILVDGPAARALMRLTWLTELRSHLLRACRAFRARRLEFQVGDGDDRFVVAPGDEAVGPACEEGQR
jgi:hypothetical protein